MAKRYDVEVIYKDGGDSSFCDFISYSLAKIYAVKMSIHSNVKETYLFGTNTDDVDYEVQEYYKKGKLAIRL